MCPQKKQKQHRCRAEGCSKLYVYQKARNTHERDVHNLQLPADKTTSAPTTSTATTSMATTSTRDHKKEHTEARLSFGFLLMSMRDAVKEGDGERLLRLYKTALPIYKAHGHTNYAYSTFLLSVQVNATLSPRLAHSLKFNRFYNSRGGKGKNLSLDLHLEHLNNFLKSFLKGLGSNLKEPSADRISRSLSVLKHLLDATDRELRVTRRSGRHRTPNQTKDIQALIEVALEAELFQTQPSREFKAFPRFDRNINHKLNWNEFVRWMNLKLSEWREHPI